VDVDLQARYLHAAIVRKTEFLEGQQPFGFKWQAGCTEVAYHPLQVFPDVMWQHETVMQLVTPGYQGPGIRLAPEPGHKAAQQQHLHGTHLPVGRHFEVSEFHKSEPSGTAVG